MSEFEHKGYTLSQVYYNQHYMIFDKNGRMVMHVPYDRPITEEKARELIEHYILLAEKLEDIAEDLKDEEI